MASDRALRDIDDDRYASVRPRSVIIWSLDNQEDYTDTGRDHVISEVWHFEGVKPRWDRNDDYSLGKVLSRGKSW